VCLVLLPSLAACTAAGAAAPATPVARPSPTRTPRVRLRTTPTPAVAPTPPSACALSALVPGQHISAGGSYTETERAAAGAMICRISRDSCAFHYLIGNLDPGVVFKRDDQPPYDEEDILMHPDLLLPLARLSQLVQEEWDGAVKLRITAAYDSLLEHDLAQTDPSRKTSLHFEGRSLDLTTWPIDTTRYGQLCSLAHCAGFDWVQDEGDHCHASLRAESLCARCRD
jgi:hypothetical protein